MSKSNSFEDALLALIFTATAIANLADDAATAPLTDLYVSLHTADPGEGASQTTHEASYTSYARVAVPRTASDWTVSSGSVSPVAPVDFPVCTGGTETITHFGIGAASSGAGTLLYSGAVTPNINVVSGKTPRLNPLTITED